MNGYFKPWRRRVGVITLGMACVILAGGIFEIYWIVLGPVVPRDRLEQLANIKRATTADVVHIIGKPHEIMDNGTWIYERWGNSGWVAIMFDDTGCVLSINDESP